MTLLQEILDSALRSDVPLTDLLRRCKVLSSRLRHSELGAWADLEQREDETRWMRRLTSGA